MFSKAILTTYKDRAELVGLCDLNQTRMDWYNRRFASQFERMIAERKPDTVIVTTVDRTHHQ